MYVYNLPNIPQVQLYTNPQPIPSHYNEGFSQYESIKFLIAQTNLCINAINNIITTGIEEPIKNKLESMALSGELTNIIESVLIYDGGTF